MPTTLWNLTTGQKIQSFSFPSGTVAFSKDGSTFAIRAARSTADPVAVWKTGSEEPFTQFQFNSSGTTLELDATGASLLAWGSFSVPNQFDTGAKIWDIATGQVRCRLESLAGRVMDGVFSPDGKRVATVSRSGSNRVIQLWDATTGAELLSLPTFVNGEILTARPTSPSGVERVSFSSDGRQLILCSPQGEETWDATPRKPDH